MRSLWRSFALQWLGGEGSAVLSAEAAPVDCLRFDGPQTRAPVFRVERVGAVSHRALLLACDRGDVDGEAQRTDGSFILD